MYMYMWQYHVSSDAVVEFQRAYGPDGEWVALFKRAKGYISTELNRHFTDPNRFITLDYWQSKNACDDFRKRFSKEFNELDRRCRKLSNSETYIGSFTVLGRS